MTAITAEDIARQLCDDCGYDLLTFTHTAKHIALTVANQVTGMPARVGVANYVDAACILNDDTLDKLEALLLALPAIWTREHGEGWE